MGYTFEELKKKTVAQLREIAKGIEHEALKGYTTMHKEELILALCSSLGIDARTHHVARVFNKGEIKRQIRELKTKRDEAIKAHNYKQLKMIRHKIHRLKRILRRATV